jgi:hypothetical protein
VEIRDSITLTPIGRNAGGTGVARCGVLPSRLLVYFFQIVFSVFIVKKVDSFKTFNHLFFSNIKNSSYFIMKIGVKVTFLAFSTLPFLIT